ncbi:FABP family protein [Actinobacteria bacterium YIM 96077]|uniref:Peroxynitrite isomerase n=1 Tax=Phytoactinopolyspora halophila TaxID=1981511 RepID=A0A329QTR5_9ACTN|nr:FABP family protein [Phytoactinopolyspora halophila]AYY14512.1 FABP family protein [Actinobacteria bacterium YIM 96077]RAW14108.1 FABP family protein [Phytoactinopolyspora halophila]
MIEIPSDLHPDCVPLVWLLGRWEGAGVGDYPTIEAFRFGQEVQFTYVPGKPFLSYQSRSWILDEDGNLVQPAARETGYWRPQGEDEVEVLLTHPTGFVEIYIGRIESARLELATRGVLKTETAKDYRSGHRLYGLVEGRLMYVYEMAAMGEDLQPHLSAELQRVEGASQAAD